MEWNTYQTGDLGVGYIRQPGTIIALPPLENNYRLSFEHAHLCPEQPFLIMKAQLGHHLLQELDKASLALLEHSVCAYLVTCHAYENYFSVCSHLYPQLNLSCFKGRDYAMFSFRSSASGTVPGTLRVSLNYSNSVAYVLDCGWRSPFLTVDKRRLWEGGSGDLFWKLFCCCFWVFVCFIISFSSLPFLFSRRVFPINQKLFRKYMPKNTFIIH